MNLKGTFLLLTLSCLILIGCNKEDEFAEADITSFDISSNALGYVITGDYFDDDQKLYEIKSDGSVVLVNVNSDKDDFYSSSEIIEVIPVNDDYFIVLAGGSSNNVWSTTYLVNRNTGDAHNITEAGTPPSPSVSEEVRLVNNHIYFINNDLNHASVESGALVKLNINSLSSTVISSNGDHVDEYAIDDNGNILTESYNSTFSNSNTRFLDSTGVLHSLPGDNYSWDYMWRGLDDELYYIHDGIHKVNASTGNASQWSSTSARGACSWDYVLTIEGKNTMIGVGDCDTYSQFYPSVVNFYTDDEFDIVKYTGAADSDEFAYLSGQLSSGSYAILKIDPSDNTFSTLTTDFEISGITSSENDEVAVTGFDLTKQQQFIGLADFSTGDITVGKYFSTSIELQQIKGR
jgi:hypothetical protein